MGGKRHEHRTIFLPAFTAAKPGLGTPVLARVGQKVGPWPGPFISLVGEPSKLKFLRLPIHCRLPADPSGSPRPDERLVPFCYQLPKYVYLRTRAPDRPAVSPPSRCRATSATRPEGYPVSRVALAILRPLSNASPFHSRWLTCPRNEYLTSCISAVRKGALRSSSCGYGLSSHVWCFMYPGCRGGRAVIMGHAYIREHLHASILLASMHTQAHVATAACPTRDGAVEATDPQA